MTEAYELGDRRRLNSVAQEALKRYGLPPDATADLINLSENATYLVTANNTRTVLRIHRAQYNTQMEIASELAWIDALRTETEIRIPEVIPAADGSRVIMAGAACSDPRPCVMFEFCPGTEPAQNDTILQSFERLGLLAARMHNHAQHWNAPRWFARRTWDYDTTIGARPCWGNWGAGMEVGWSERKLLDRLCGRIATRLHEYGKPAARFGLVHADMRLANLLFDGPSTTYVIDFDDCGYSWYLYDLASALTLLEDRSDVGALIESWLRGYRRVRALSAADVEMIPTLVLLRRLLIVAWIGSHPDTEIAVTEGPAHTRTTCDLAERYLGGALSWT